METLARSGKGLRGFLAWWRAGLAGWLPERLRESLAGGQDRLLLQPQGGELLLRRQHGDELLDIANLPLPLPGNGVGDPMADILRDGVLEMPRWLLMPVANSLRRNLVLPAAARDALRGVLGFEIERQTPFTAADVLYDGRVLQTREDGQLLVELVVLPRRQFDAVAEHLGSLMQGLTGADMADADGRPLGVNLLPPEQRQRKRDPWVWWKLGFGVLGALALVLGLGQVVENREAAASKLQATVAKRSEQARAVSVQRQQLVDAVEGAAYLHGQRNGRAPTVEVMNALAERIPDGAYLEKLAIEGEQLTLIGLSNQAAALVGKLEGARQWDAPALSGALQQDPRSRMDRFTMVAQLRGGPQQQPEAARGAR